CACPSGGIQRQAPAVDKRQKIASSSMGLERYWIPHFLLKNLIFNSGVVEKIYIFACLLACLPKTINESTG
ncbi:MAG: hypothetical protein ABL892_02195, partial [Thiobacillaceae bacterium]